MATNYAGESGIENIMLKQGGGDSQPAYGCVS